MFRFIFKIFAKTFLVIYSFLKFITVILAFVVLASLSAILAGISSYSLIANNDKKAINPNYNTVVIDKVSVKSGYGIDEEAMSFLELRKALKDLSENKKVDNIVINLDTFGISIAELNELKDDFKNTNKNIYAYATYMNKVTYSKALIADHIIMPPSSAASFSLASLYSESLYFKNLYDKIGIEVIDFKTGNHKNYNESEVRSTMSKETESTLKMILNKYEKFFNNNFDTFRKDSKEQYITDLKNKDLIFSNAKIAYEKKYIDDLYYFDDFLDTFEYINIKDYAKTIVDQNPITAEQNIAVLELTGTIVDDDDSANQDAFITPKKIKKAISKIKKTPHLCGIIIRIESPGGSAFASERIYHLLKEYNKDSGVPIYIQASNTMASGGYFIAMSGSKVFASDYSIVGSIGVVAKAYKFTNLLDKLGINSITVVSNSDSSIETNFNPFIPKNSVEIEKFNKNLEHIYKDFKSVVSVNRKKDMSTIEKLAGGKIYSVDEAYENGLIDGIKTFDEVVEEMTTSLNLTNPNIVEIEVSNINYVEYIMKKLNLNLVSTKFNKIQYLFE